MYQVSGLGKYLMHYPTNKLAKTCSLAHPLSIKKVFRIWIVLPLDESDTWTKALIEKTHPSPLR